MSERRKHFLINKPLQLRYMVYFSATLFLVSSVILGSLYFGIWGGILDAFNDQRVRDQLLIATRLTEYEAARVPSSQKEEGSLLSFFKQSEKLSQRQREVFRDVLDETNKKLITKLILLIFLIAWGSIYLSHKIAGPLYRLHTTLNDVDQGDFSKRVHLRKGDEIQFLAVQMNHSLEELDKTFCRLKNILQQHEHNPDVLIPRLKEELGKIKTSADH